MRITGKEIRQKSFEKNFRGYEKDEVAAFLNFLGDQWERMVQEKDDLEMRLEKSEKEATKLKEVEESLFRTLKAAEDTGATMIEEASKAADEILGDARLNADALMNEAKRQSQQLLTSADEKSKEIMENLKTDIKGLVDSYENLLTQREIVIKNLEKLSENINNSISASSKSFEKVDVTPHAKIVEEMAKLHALSAAKIMEAPLEVDPPQKVEKVENNDRTTDEFTTEDEVQLEINDAVEETAVQAQHEDPQPDDEPQLALDSDTEATNDDAETVEKEKPEHITSENEEPVIPQSTADTSEVEEADSKPKNNPKEGGSFFDQFD